MRRIKYCLDTHPLIWYFTGQQTLSKIAKSTLDEIFVHNASCFIPTIVLLETFHLSLKKPSFVFPKFLDSLRLENITIVPLDAVVLSYCYRLPRNLDIHDRVIAATAQATKATLITKDTVIRNTHVIRTIW